MVKVTVKESKSWGNYIDKGKTYVEYESNPFMTLDSANDGYKLKKMLEHLGIEVEFKIIENTDTVNF